MRVASRLWQVGAALLPREVERAVRRLVATPDRRLASREALDDVAELLLSNIDRRVRALTVDLGEGGLSLLCAIAPELGELVRVNFRGLVLEGRVRHVARQGDAYRLGIEAT
jgi:hypothetical protein